LLALLSLLLIGVGTLAADASGSESGKMLLEKHCSRCHSIEATGESPLKGAPPLREIYLKYPIEQLEYGFAEGMGSRHREMPQIQFSAERSRQS
jgi:cytochrome c